MDAELEARSNPASGPAAGGTEPETGWQLKMFSVTLKKQQKLRLLLRQIGDTSDKECLLVTNGDNNGALNYHFRRHGGRWTWVENEGDHIAEMQELLADPVLLGEPARIPAPDACFDVVVSIDVHEHLDDCVGFNRELHRVTRPGGTVVVTTPNGDPWKPVTILKQLVGMTKEKYGHRVIGYNLRQHRRMLREAGLQTIAGASYSRFFTEMLEFFINFTYVMVLGKRGGSRVKEGTIAPSSQSELRSVEKQYRIYAAVYPILRAVSALDTLLFFFTGYAVSAVARRA